MRSHENKITYSIVDDYILENIPEFTEYFYKVYDNSDREKKYEVMWALSLFFRDSYLDGDYNVWDWGLEILRVINNIYKSSDPKCRELVCIGFIENLLSSDDGKMKQLRFSLNFSGLQECFDKVYAFWYNWL